jgi:hypothetical protein
MAIQQQETLRRVQQKAARVRSGGTRAGAAAAYRRAQERRVGQALAEWLPQTELAGVVRLQAAIPAVLEMTGSEARLGALPLHPLD